MENFVHHIETKIIFGTGRIQTVGEEVRRAGGTRLLLMYGKNSIKANGLYDTVVESLKTEEIEYVELSGVKSNPSIESVRIGKELVEEHQLDFILAVGGGSVIDAAKAVSVSAFYDGDPWDLFTGAQTPLESIPIGTIVTLAATGSEMNYVTVISNEATEQKIALEKPVLRPRFTFEDPTLMYTLPAYQTAAGASDIMSHLLEQYFTSHEDEGINDRLAEGMMINVLDYGKKAIDEPSNYQARANLMWTSTLALNGMLTDGKTGGDWTCHRIEHEVSAIYDVTHGAGLAILYPHVLKKYLEKDIMEEKSLVKFINFARNVFKLQGEDEKALAQAAIDCLSDWFRSLGMPQSLSEERVDATRITDMSHRCIKLGISQRYQTLEEIDVIDIYNSAL